MTVPTPDTHARLRLGLCQIQTVPWDVEGNLARTLDALHSAASQGADLAVTPECVLNGYGPLHDEETREKSRATAVAVDGAELRSVADAARRFGMDVTVGFAERAAGGLIHNSAAYFGRDGEMKGLYRKVHCRDFEDVGHAGIFTPGNEFAVVRLERGDRSFTIGTMICFDRERPETVRCLRALGAELVVCPLATNTSRLDQLDTSRADNELVTRVRAAENEVFVAVVNHADTFNGGSFVVGPGGEVLVQMGEGAEVAVVDLPLGCISADFHSKPYGWMGWGFVRQQVYERYLKD